MIKVDLWVARLTLEYKSIQTEQAILMLKLKVPISVRLIKLKEWDINQQLLITLPWIINYKQMSIWIVNSILKQVFILNIQITYKTEPHKIPLTDQKRPLKQVMLSTKS